MGYEQAFPRSRVGDGSGDVAVRRWREWPSNHLQRATDAQGDRLRPSGRSGQRITGRGKRSASRRFRRTDAGWPMASPGPMVRQRCGCGCSPRRPPRRLAHEARPQFSRGWEMAGLHHRRLRGGNARRWRRPRRAVKSKLGLRNLVGGESATIDDVATAAFSDNGKFLVMRRYPIKGARRRRHRYRPPRPRHGRGHRLRQRRRLRLQ